MATFKNSNFKKRDYEATNIVFVQADQKPTHDLNGNEITDNRWIACEEDEIKELGCNQLFKQDGAYYFGWL